MHKLLSHFLHSGNIPHALLFAGPRNSQKREAAYVFTLELLKTKKKIENHPDAHLFFPEGKIGMHPVSTIRQLIQDAALAPYEAQKKVFILHEAEKMLPSSSNGLLKTLEEPPPHTLIILLSDHPDRLLPTILSRCQVLEFPPSDKRQALDSVLLEILAGDTKKLSNFESEYPEALFETILFWYRDRALLEMGGDESSLYFPEHLPQLKKTPFFPLEEVEKKVKLARLASERSTKLSTVLEILFLSLNH